MAGPCKGTGHSSFKTVYSQAAQQQASVVGEGLAFLWHGDLAAFQRLVGQRRQQLVVDVSPTQGMG